METIINEGSARLKIPKAEKVSKEMEVFYNPIMSLNRDISILLLNSINKSNLQIADPLAASGVRSIRFLKELNKNKIKEIWINDKSKSALRLIKKNLILNKISFNKNKKIMLKNEDANLFLLNSEGFDYIDIDPFGSPNYFLDSACKKISRDGILAVTATDTSALCGTFPKACLRKYWAVPKKDAMMHETGLRIIIRKIQLIAGQYDKALAPLVSYSKEHYMRTFLRSDKGKGKVDKILKQHDCYNDAGPMWLGTLWDKKLVKKMSNESIHFFSKENNELTKLLKLLEEESKINAVGFYDLHEVCGKNKIKRIQKKEILLAQIRRLGYNASGTHFKGEGIRSDIPYSELVDLMKKE